MEIVKLFLRLLNYLSLVISDLVLKLLQLSVFREHLVTLALQLLYLRPTLPFCLMAPFYFRLLVV